MLQPPLLTNIIIFNRELRRILDKTLDSGGGGGWGSWDGLTIRLTEDRQKLGGWVCE